MRLQFEPLAVAGDHADNFGLSFVVMPELPEIAPGKHMSFQLMKTPDGLYVAWWTDAMGNLRAMLYYNEEQAIEWLRSVGGGSYLKFKSEPARYEVTETEVITLDWE